MTFSLWHCLYSHYLGHCFYSHYLGHCLYSHYSIDTQVVKQYYFNFNHKLCSSVLTPVRFHSPIIPHSEEEKTNSSWKTSHFEDSDEEEEEPGKSLPPSLAHDCGRQSMSPLVSIASELGHTTISILVNLFHYMYPDFGGDLLCVYVVSLQFDPHPVVFNICTQSQYHGGVHKKAVLVPIIVLTNKKYNTFKNTNL